MKIYKIRAWVNTRNRREMIEHPYRFEEVVVGNLQTAQRLFREQVKELETWALYSKHSGKVELCEPHIFDDGTLAYWPEGKEYIDTWEFNM